MKVIVPDVDGMLILGPRFSDEFPKAAGLPEGAVNELFDSGDFFKCQKGELDLWELLEKKYAERWGGSADDVLKFWFSLGKVNGEVVDYLKRLRQEKGVKVVLGTNQEKYRLAHLLSVLKTDWIDGVIASCEVGFLKPDPKFYEQIEKIFPDTKKKDILIFDDRPATIDKLRELGYEAEVFKNLDDLKKLVESK